MAVPQKKLARIPSVVGGRPMPSSGSSHKQQASTSSIYSTTSVHNNNHHHHTSIDTESNFPELVSPKPQKPMSTVSNDISRSLENQENNQYSSSDTQSWYVGDDNNVSITVPQQYQYQNQQSQQAAFYSQSTNGQQYGNIHSRNNENRQSEPNVLPSQYTQQPGRVSLDVNGIDQYPEPRRGYSAPASPILSSNSQQLMNQGSPNIYNEQLNQGGQNIYNEQLNRGGPNIYNEQFNQDLSQTTDLPLKRDPPTLTVVTDPNLLKYPGQVYASNQNYSQPSWNAQQNGQYAPIPITRPLSQGSTPSRQSSYHLRVPSPSGSSHDSTSIGPDRFSFYGNPDRFSGIRAPNTSTLRLQIDDTNAKRMTMTSFTLVSDEKARERYRDAARKSNNPILQVEYAKFLIGMSDVYVTADMGQDGGPPLNKNDTYTKLVEEAVYWIDKLSSKNQPEASYIKGTWHEFGKFGKEQSTEKALKLYNSASKLDHPKANFKVGEYYEHQRNSGRALSFYQKAASLGDVSSFYRLALSFMLGDLKQEVNYKQALIYLKQAATKANEDCPEGAYVYGMILAKEYTKARVPDELVVPDEHEAKELIQKAANLGHVAALFKMGHFHEYATLGCPYDPVLSVSYYKRAAEKGNFEAHMALSKWYLCGAEGYFDQNEVLAYEHAEMAAKAGLPAAEFAMGYFHEVGINAPIDMTVANVWYSKAAGHGNADAKQRIARGGTITRHEHELQQTKLKKQRKNKKEKDCIIM